MSFGFRLTVVLAPGYRLAHDVPECEISLPDPIGTVLLKGLGSDTISNAAHLAFVGSGFADENLASEVGCSLKNALRLAGVSSHLPVDVGQDRFRGGAGPSVKETAAEDGVQLLDDVHGLQVYEETGEPVVLTMNASLTSVTDYDRFIASLRGYVAHADSLGLAEELACDLLALSAFEASDRARLVTAATAGEVLSDRSRRAGLAASLVDEFIERVDRELDDLSGRGSPQDEITELQSLKGTLVDARHISISAAFRALADEAAPGETANARTVLKRSYDARSYIVHEGEPGNDLPSLTSQLVRVLGDVILARVKR